MKRIIIAASLFAAPAFAQVSPAPKWDTSTPEARQIADYAAAVEREVARDNEWRNQTGEERRPWGTAARLNAYGCIVQGAFMTCPGQPK